MKRSCDHVLNKVDILCEKKKKKEKEARFNNLLVSSHCFSSNCLSTISKNVDIKQ